MIYCKIKNEQFDNFIYLNGGWVYYEKCPICSMRLNSDGSNHKEFWESHVEVYEDDLEEDSGFYYDIEEMDRRIKNAHENPIVVPEHIKTPEEFCEWIMNYDTTKIESAIELSKSVEGVEVLGYTKEARVKHMKQIFEDYKEK